MRVIMGSVGARFIAPWGGARHLACLYEFVNLHYRALCLPFACDYIVSAAYVTYQRLSVYFL